MRFSSWRSVRAGAGLLVLPLLPAACVSQKLTTERNADTITPSLVVERFLRASNSNDLDTMARLFGTRDGSILERDRRSEVEQRMFALASILRHQDFAVVGQRIVPGRTGEAVRIIVNMQFLDRRVVVPFTVVRTDQDSWLVEQVDLEPIMRLD